METYLNGRKQCKGIGCMFNGCPLENNPLGINNKIQ